MTLHAAKGLEFPARLHRRARTRASSRTRRARDDDNELEEERRLLFVGITRAERELYLSRSQVREFRGQRQMTIPSSAFSAELPEDVIDRHSRPTPTARPSRDLDRNRSGVPTRRPTRPEFGTDPASD